MNVLKLLTYINKMVKIVRVVLYLFFTVIVALCIFISSAIVSSKSI